MIRSRGGFFPHGLLDLAKMRHLDGVDALVDLERFQLGDELAHRQAILHAQILACACAMLVFSIDSNEKHGKKIWILTFFNDSVSGDVDAGLVQGFLHVCRRYI